MDLLTSGFREAVRLLIGGDPEIWSILFLSLQVSGSATFIALALGIPAGAALGLTRFPGRTLLVSLVNTGMGLPPVEVYKGEESPAQLAQETKPQEPYGRILWEYVLKSPYMWVISFANLAVYVLRYAQMTWGPSFLQEDKGEELGTRIAQWLSPLNVRPPSAT